ncbi:hypothetical protein OIV19_21595 [Brucella sp. HL-2]|nr:hypothetical protein [Brucella sp. HL-2]MCV9910193.1 hypothetical protein [Brucella sp. HL-2]
MFENLDFIDNVRTKRKKDPIAQADTPEKKPRQTANFLDGVQACTLHKQLMSYYITEQDRQYQNRREQAEDDDFYDNIQWDPADAQVLKERGQLPLVYNVLSASVDWVTGTEKRTRTDFKVLPRRKDESEPAQRKTELLKYLSDTSRTPFHKSRAFEDAVRVGIGWLEDGFDAEADGEPIFTRYEDWRNMLYDSTAMELDLSDARYVFRHKWVDLDIAEAMFSKRKGLLQRSATAEQGYYGLDELSDEISDQKEIENQHAHAGVGVSNRSEVGGYHRKRVRIVEAWFRRPVETMRMSGGTFSGEIFDPFSQAHRDQLAYREADLVKSVIMRMHVAIFTSAGMLYLGRSPYRHNKYPFTPIWGYRRAKDGLPYGMIRRLKDIQRDVNKRASKALHILSTSKTIMDDDAIDDLDAFLEEVARPDAVIIKKRGTELRIDTDRELSQGHLELMSRSIAMVQQASGVTDELLGRRTNASSGIAIQRRQDQGSMSTAKLFDNNIFAQQVRGEKVLSLVEQFMSEKKAFRITNKRGQAEFIEVNDGLPDNDITRTKADYVIDEEELRSTQRQAQVDQLMEMVTRMPPQIGMAFLDLIVQMTDLPYADEIAKRIRSISKMPDPDADPNEIPPEQQAAEAAAQKQAQMAEAVAQAEIRTKNAKAARDEAAATEIQAKIVNTRVDAQGKALTAAGQAVASPSAVTIADHILHESGFDSRSTMEETEAAALLEQQKEAEAAGNREAMEGQLLGHSPEELTGAAPNGNGI